MVDTVDIFFKPALKEINLNVPDQIQRVLNHSSYVLMVTNGKNAISKIWVDRKSKRLGGSWGGSGALSQTDILSCDPEAFRQPD